MPKSGNEDTQTNETLLNDAGWEMLCICLEVNILETPVVNFEKFSYLCHPLLINGINLIPETNHSLITRLLMVRGSWSEAHGTCLKSRGSRLMTKKNWRLGLAPGGTRATFCLGHEP